MWLTYFYQSTLQAYNNLIYRIRIMTIASFMLFGKDSSIDMRWLGTLGAYELCAELSSSRQKMRQAKSRHTTPPWSGVWWVRLKTKSKEGAKKKKSTKQNTKLSVSVKSLVWCMMLQIFSLVFKKIPVDGKILMIGRKYELSKTQSKTLRYHISERSNRQKSR